MNPPGATLMLILQRAIALEKETGEQPWVWSQVQAAPAHLIQLRVLGLVEVVGTARRGRLYIVTGAGRQEPPTWLPQPLSLRVVGPLRRAGITTVSQLIARDPHNPKVRGIGFAARYTIWQALRAAGYSPAWGKEYGG
ncbi:MAG: hypothetical protein Q8O40_03665 [Chloroflexota bacterium]|nr:hypothetical protein [Chloroflexota bacterium]